MTDVFTESLATWRDYTESPWARIRYAVAAEVLRRHVEGDRLRVLDVGGGDGLDSLPLALAGHDVTIVDPSQAWLDEAGRRAAASATTVSTICGGLDDLPEGEWDVVLCHFVLRYRSVADDDVEALASRVCSGGLLSVIDMNPDGKVLSRLVNDGPAAALAELDAERAEVVTFGIDARKVSAKEVIRDAQAAGLTPLARYGIRIANDLIVDNSDKHDPAYFRELLALELRLCDREPFNRLGVAWQLVLRR